MRNPLRPLRDWLAQHEAAVPEIDPDLLVLLKQGAVDVRSINRATRRRYGFRGPVMSEGSPTISRYIRRHYTKLDGLEHQHMTRRQRRIAARTKRFALARGLV